MRLLRELRPAILSGAPNVFALLVAGALGVARVLIGDALTANLLTLHDITRTADGRPTVELMRRVYDGLRRLA